MIDDIIEKQFEATFNRYDDEFDRLCEIGVSSLRTFNRWMFSILPEMAMKARRQEPFPGRLNQFAQFHGKDYEEELSGSGPSDFFHEGGNR